MLPIHTVQRKYQSDITSIHKWTVKRKKDGYESLINRAKHQGGIKLKETHKNRIKKWIEKDLNISITQVKENLEKQFNLKV